MTSRTTKQAARERQEREGIPYTEALRRVLKERGEDATVDETVEGTHFDGLTNQESAQAILNALPHKDVEGIPEINDARKWLDAQFDLLDAFEDADPASVPVHCEPDLKRWLIQTSTPEGLRAEVDRLSALVGLSPELQAQADTWRSLVETKAPVALQMVLPRLSPPVPREPSLRMPVVEYAEGTPRTYPAYRLGVYADGLKNPVAWSSGDEAVLVVLGRPGTGKTTLATTLASQARHVYVVTTQPKEWEDVGVEHVYDPSAGQEPPTWKMDRDALLVVDVLVTDRDAEEPDRKEWARWVGERVQRKGCTMLVTSLAWRDVYHLDSVLPSTALVVTMGCSDPAMVRRDDSTGRFEPGLGVIGTMQAKGACFQVNEPGLPNRTA